MNRVFSQRMFDLLVSFGQTIPGKTIHSLVLVLVVSLLAATPRTCANDKRRIPSVDPILAALESSDPSIRHLAVRSLIELDYRRRVEPVIVELILDPELSKAERLWLQAAWYIDRPDERDDAFEKLQEAVLSSDASFGGEAAMALFFLGWTVSAEQADVASWRTAVFDRPMSSPYGMGLFRNEASQELEPDAFRQLEEILSDSNDARWFQAVEVLAFVPSLSNSQFERLSQAHQTFPELERRRRLKAALWAHQPDKDLQSTLQQEMLQSLDVQSAAPGSNSQTNQAWETFILEVCSRRADGSAQEALEQLQARQDLSVESQIQISKALVRIHRRQTRSLEVIDWIIIGIYGMAMIAIGFFYARRTRNAEDYLLGGRSMAPSLVGLSMFASLLSTLTYLAQPGEVIKNGPMTFVQVASYPFVFLIVGWFLIPFIMRLKVTSGYEMLEQRLGLSSRLLGSCIFLILRLLWMATIIYVTTSTVLIPMLNWEPSMTPWVCAVIGIVTVVYTSLGGLRAVVVTDAVQTVILFGGALLALLIITIDFRGVQGWWPDEWYGHWQSPVWFDPSIRTSFVGLFLAMFTWQVFTNGSDQMAFQRYLATKDVRSARSVLAVSLVTSAVVIGFLVCLGLALLAYYREFPEWLPDERTVYGDADKLLPAFIVGRLPVGVSGLVIAGLLAAAMSSLSSGVSASSSVISSDLVNRLRKKPLSDCAQVSLAKWLSLVVGVAVVGLSLYVSVVPGNIFELCFKIVNLLVGPLFVLFFLAFFVRQANVVGAWAGVLSGSIAAIVIGFWEQLFAGPPPISFVWLTPLSFLVGIGAAIPASYVMRRSDTK